jgi:hypothetical protein
MNRSSIRVKTDDHSLSYGGVISLRRPTMTGCIWQESCLSGSTCPVPVTSDSFSYEIHIVKCSSRILIELQHSMGAVVSRGGRHD